jgi:flagella basal body P-ring formation protein FlgA
MMRALLLLAFVSAVPLGGAAAQDVAPVPTRVIYPGETITSGAIQEAKLKRGSRLTSDMAASAEELIGKVSRRTLLPGRTIPLSALREVYLVESGKPVEVRFVAGGLIIATTAVPLQDGSAGDMIKVRNMDSGTVFMGVVLADGSIQVSAS